MKKDIKYKGRYNLPKCPGCGKQLSRKDAKGCHSCSVKGKDNPMYGRHHKDGAKKIIGIKNSGINNFWFGKKRPEHSDKMYRNGNPNWQGGMTDLPYPIDFDNRLKLKIRKRDNYTCQNCGIIEEEHIIINGKDLSVHHIDYNKQNCEENNLITLCNQCNIRANYNREYWQEFYTVKVKSK